MTSGPRVDVVASRSFSVPPARVFAAWLDPTVARKFLFATASGEMVRAEIDARTGGQFCFVDRRAGEEFEHIGTYLEIDQPRRLVFTFAVPKFSAEETKVAIDIVAADSGCLLTLTHSGVDADYANGTEAGWTIILDMLAAALG